MGLRATLVELWNRKIKFNKGEKVYYNGEENLYPNEIERVVQNSPSASNGATTMAKYIAGLGLDVDVTLSDGVLLSKRITDIADDISVQYGSFVHIAYRIEVDGDQFSFVPATIKTLDYCKCRKRKEDDNDNEGVIVHKDFEEKSSMFGQQDDELKWYYPYNNNKRVILDQIKRDAKKYLKKNPDAPLSELLPHYRGQVYYLNLTPNYQYAISKFNPVFNDCDTEYRMSVYSNNMTREGFLGKLAVLTAGLDEQTSEQIKEDVSKWLGSENSGSVYFLEIENTENLDNNFKIVNVPSQFDDAQFTNTEQRVRANILGACNNVPSILVFGADGGSIFGNSGELIKQAKMYYTEQTEGERKAVEDMLKEIGFEVKIKPLIELKEEIEDDSNR